MSSSKLLSIEAALELILSEHFENYQNPHETIYRVWLLLNRHTVGTFATIPAVNRPDLPETVFK
jgi:hypothetical protein